MKNGYGTTTDTTIVATTVTKIPIAATAALDIAAGIKVVPSKATYSILVYFPHEHIVVT